jgi:hypothetical protein
MTGLAASPLGLLIGLLLGALGGGGSVLAVPVLVYIVGQTPQAATSTSLVIVALTSLGGLAVHLRVGNVRLVAGIAFGAAGIGGSVAGSHINSMLPPRVLLVAFSVLMIVAAAGMLRRTSGSEPTLHEWLPGSGAATIVRARVSAGTVTRVLVAGTVVGLLTGLFGVGGGFVIVPALVLVLGFAMPTAVGTSLVIITLNAVTALAARMIGGGHIDWSVAWPFTAAGLIGVVIGTALANRISPDRLSRAFAVLLIAVAAWMTIDAVALG